MQPRPEGPPVMFIIIMTLYFLFFCGGALIVAIAIWRGMRALEKIADKIQAK
jgi:hypothetical protein